MSADLTPGIYEHYKSTPDDRRYYQVLGVARHTETGEKFALYIPLYVSAEHDGPRWQIRPLEMFLGSVGVGEETVPRFRYIGQEL